jgi:hypothetical protein
MSCPDSVPIYTFFPAIFAVLIFFRLLKISPDSKGIDDKIARNFITRDVL